MLNKKRRAVQNDPFVRRHRNFFVGVFLLIPVIAIPGLLGYTFFKSQFFQRDITLYAVYDNSYGLSRGNRVTISGTTIGHVQSVELLRERYVVVVLSVRQEFQHLVRKDTRALLKQMNFVVGDWEIELTGGSDGERVIDDADTLKAEYPLRIDRTIEQITEMVSVAGEILHLVFSGEGTIGRLLTEDTLYRHIDQLAETAALLATEARKTMTGVDSLLATLETAGKSGQLVLDSIPAVVELVKSALEEANHIIASASELSETVPALVDDLDDTLEEVDLILKGLQKNRMLRRMMGRHPDPLLIDYP